jgi:hypothetical protein
LTFSARVRFDEAGQIAGWAARLASVAVITAAQLIVAALHARFAVVLRSMACFMATRCM